MHCINVRVGLFCAYMYIVITSELKLIRLLEGRNYFILVSVDVSWVREIINLFSLCQSPVQFMVTEGVFTGR